MGYMNIKTRENYGAFNMDLFKKALVESIEAMRGGEEGTSREILARCLVKNCMSAEIDKVKVKYEYESRDEDLLILKTADVTDFFFHKDDGNKGKLVFASENRSGKESEESFAELFKLIETFHAESAKRGDCIKKNKLISSGSTVEKFDSLFSLILPDSVYESARPKNVLGKMINSKGGKKGFKICEKNGDGDMYIEEIVIKMEPADEKTERWMTENADEANGAIAGDIFGYYARAYLYDEYMLFMERRGLFEVSGGFENFLRMKRTAMENKIIMPSSREKVKTVLGYYFYTVHPYAPKIDGDSVIKIDDNSGQESGIVFELPLTIKQNNPVYNANPSISKMAEEALSGTERYDSLERLLVAKELGQKGKPDFASGDNAFYHRMRIGVLAYGFRILLDRITEGKNAPELTNAVLRKMEEKYEYDYVLNYKLTAYVTGLLALALFLYEIDDKEANHITENYFDLMKKMVDDADGFYSITLKEFVKTAIMNGDGRLLGSADPVFVDLAKEIASYQKAVFDAISRGGWKKRDYKKRRADEIVNAFIKGFSVPSRDFSFMVDIYNQEITDGIREDIVEDLYSVKVGVNKSDIHFIHKSDKSFYMIPKDIGTKKTIVIANIYATKDECEESFLPENMEKSIGIYSVFDPYIFAEVRRCLRRKNTYGIDRTEKMETETALKTAVYFYFITMLYPIIWLDRHFQSKGEELSMFSMELFSKEEDRESDDFLGELYSMGRMFMSDIRYVLSEFKTKGLYTPTILKKEYVSGYDRSIGYRARQSFYSLVRESGTFETDFGDGELNGRSVIGTFYPITVTSYRSDRTNKTLYVGSRKDMERYFLFFEVNVDGNVMRKKKGFVKTTYERVPKKLNLSKGSIFCKNGIYMNKKLFMDYFGTGRDNSEIVSFFVTTSRSIFGNGKTGGGYRGGTKDYVVNEFGRFEGFDVYERTRIVRDDSVGNGKTGVSRNFSTMLKFEPHRDAMKSLFDADMNGTGDLKRRVEDVLSKTLYPLLVHVNNKIYDDGSSVSLSFFSEVGDSSFLRPSFASLKVELRSMGTGRGSSPVAHLFIKNLVIVDRISQMIKIGMDKRKKKVEKAADTSSS